jgi:hypothetical protein
MYLPIEDHASGYPQARAETDTLSTEGKEFFVIGPRSRTVDCRGRRRRRKLIIEEDGK